MWQLIEKLATATAHHAVLNLAYAERQKSRARVRLDNGVEAAVLLPRGTVLKQGECLRAESGEVVRIAAAAEGLSVVRGTDALVLARACYHLGNRHAALQIDLGTLYYLHDHVLDDMVRGLGLVVTYEERPFEPEPGAYHGTHAHDHRHG